jgi:hypothetical protein
VKINRPIQQGPVDPSTGYPTGPVDQIAPSSVMAPSTSSFTGGGGGGSSWGGGGGGGGGAETAPPDTSDPGSEASIQEQEAALEAAARRDSASMPGPDASESAPGAKPMSTGMKIGVAAAIGYGIYTMFFSKGG